MAKLINQGVQLSGDLITRGTVQLVVFQFDGAGDVLWARGTTKPVDGNVGFAVGALWIDTDGGVGTTLYVNEGSTTSCDFNAAT